MKKKRILNAYTKKKGISMKVNKKIKILAKFVVSVVVWSLIYFLYIMPCLGVLFNFNFLSPEAWQEKYLAFVNYNWRIRTLPDVLLVSMMLGWIPLYFIGLIMFFKVKWNIFVIKPKPKTVVKRALDIKKDKPQYSKPRAMPSTIQMSKYVAPQLPGQEKQKTQESGNKSHKNVLQMIKQMAVVARKFQVEIFQHILLEGYRVPMAISTAARAMMIEIVNAKGANWSVDFKDDVLESAWYSQEATMEKMVLDLVKSSEALERAEPGSEVIKVICLTDGRLVNAKQTVEYFQKYGIHLICFNEGQPKSDIIDFASFIAAYFDLKEGETDPSLVKLEKVPLKKDMVANQSQTPSDTQQTTGEGNNAQSGNNASSQTTQLPDAMPDQQAQASVSDVSSDEQKVVSVYPSVQEEDEEVIPVVDDEILTSEILPEQKLIDEDSSEDDPKIVTAVAKG